MLDPKTQDSRSFQGSRYGNAHSSVVGDCHASHQKYEVHGDSVKLSFMQPESRIQSEHPWPAPWLSKTTGNSAFWLLNAIQFLNAPGEWYLDRDAQKLYYWPRKGEQMETAQVIAPYLETLVRVQGNIDHPVSNIHFKGISFQHTGWLRPSEQGHVPHQVGMYMTDAYSLKIPGTADKKPWKSSLDWSSGCCRFRKFCGS